MPLHPTPHPQYTMTHTRFLPDLSHTSSEFKYGCKNKHDHNQIILTIFLQDSYSGADFAKKEVQDEYGVVTGEYRVALPDGRIQIVTYHADHEGGFIADVKYEGAAVYPEPHHGPAPYAPAHPAPLHHGGPPHGLLG